MHKKKRTSVVLRVLVLLFLVSSIVSLGGLEMDLLRVKKDVATKEKSLQEAKIRLETLQNLLDKGTERDFIEKAARDRLGYVYADEDIYIDISGK